MTKEEYRALRKALLSAKKAADRTFSKIDVVMDLVPTEEWPEYHQLKGKVYQAYTTLDTKINKLRKDFKNEHSNNRKSRLVG